MGSFMQHHFHGVLNLSPDLAWLGKGSCVHLLTACGRDGHTPHIAAREMSHPLSSWLLLAAKNSVRDGAMLEIEAIIGRHTCVGRFVVLGSQG